jgi:hypothetical protein
MLFATQIIKHLFEIDIRTVNFTFGLVFTKRKINSPNVYLKQMFDDLCSKQHNIDL